MTEKIPKHAASAVSVTAVIRFAHFSSVQSSCISSRTYRGVSSEYIPVQKQFADVITADVISRATSGSGRSTSGFGYWHSIATFF